MAAQYQSPVVMHGTHQAALSATPSHLAPTPTIQNPQGMVEEPRNYTRSHDQSKIQQLAKMFEETLKNQQIILRGQGQQGKWQKQTQPDKQGPEQSEGSETSQEKGMKESMIQGRSEIDH